MKGLTDNEIRVLDFLIRNFTEKFSINEIGRRMKLSPRGIYKILKKLELMGMIKPEPIGNLISFRINLKEEANKKLAEYVLMQDDLNTYAKIQAEDMKALFSYSLAGILYGSILTKGKEAKDIDIMLILDDKTYRKDFESIKIKLQEITKLKPKHVHDLILTKKDLLEGIRKRDAVVIDAIRTGKILWGSYLIGEAIDNDTTGQHD